MLPEQLLPLEHLAKVTKGLNEVLQRDPGTPVWTLETSTRESHGKVSGVYGSQGFF